MMILVTSNSNLLNYVPYLTIITTMSSKIVSLHCTKNPTRTNGNERNHKGTKRFHNHSQAQLSKYKIETGTAILFNSKELDRQISTTRNTKICIWLHQLCLKSGFGAQLEEKTFDENEYDGGDSIDEFDCIDISEDVDGIHDEYNFKTKEKMYEYKIYNGIVSLCVV